MNMTGVRNGVVGAGWGTEIAYVRRDSFWIEHEGQDEGRDEGKQGRDSQATAPIFVAAASKAIQGRTSSEDGTQTAGDFDVPARGWTRVSSPWVLALTAGAFVLGLAVSPLVRPGHAPPPAPAQVSVVPAAVEPTAPSVPPPAPAPVVPRCAPSDAEVTAAAMPDAPITRSARTAARSRSSASSSTSGAWSSRPQAKKDTSKTRPADAEASTGEAPVDATASEKADKKADKKPGKKVDPAAPKKPAEKAWVDPWAASAVVVVPAG
jgi:hypothetical protein